MSITTKFVILLLNLLVVAQCLHISNRQTEGLEELIRKPRMNNGTEIQWEQVPFMARLIKSTSYSRMFCSAAVISPHYLITAGHCVMDYYRIEVYIGNDTYKVDNGILHENFTFYYEDGDRPPLNDIALIQIRGKIKDFKNGLALVTEKEAPKEGQEVKIYGYGFKSVNEDSPLSYRKRPLKTMSEIVKNHDECKEVADYQDKDLNSVFCGIAPGGGGACVGDSGGPAFINGKLAGVFSFLYGTYCNTKYGPDLFTRIDKSYEWILHNTGDDAEGIKRRAEAARKV